jgi:redox-sensitive bicupin YhaK (pirin superfamily)
MRFHCFYFRIDPARYLCLKQVGRLTMIEKRSFETLGHADHGWLNARHHFSFANYHDPSRMGWGSLRVWNDDEIAANSGFPAHPHRDMEIITYVRSGAITHQDSMGNTGRTAAGDVQVMSAGTGVRHAEYNLEPETTTLFQIWIEPKRAGGSPSWGAKPFPKGDRSGSFATLASGFADEIEAGALPIRADARVLGATLKAGETLDYALADGRHGYLVPATGAVDVDGVALKARDGAALTGGETIRINPREDAELVMVYSE